MTMVDEMDFGSLGEKKKAIFCVIPEPPQIVRTAQKST